MKKLTVTIIVLCLALVLASCSGAPSVAQEQTSSDSVAQEEPPRAPDLAGNWKQVNGNSEDSYQEAVIQGDTIEIYWVTASTDTKSLYWAGSFVAPDTADEPYSWDSVNDKEKTDSALLASGDDTKPFTYEGGQIIYDVSAMGMTQTVKLEKQ